MAWPKELVLVRHAESEGNRLSVEDRAAFECATHAYGITARGRRQAEITGAWLRDVYPDGFDVYYTSYYRRARETMRLLFPDANIYEDARLAEAQRGIYHSYTREQVDEHFPLERLRKTCEGLYHYRPPGGENWADVELRIHSFLGTIARDMGEKRVLIVVHGHWLLLFQRLIDHFSIEEAVRRYGQGVAENASVMRYGGASGHLILDEYRVPWSGLL